MKRPNFEVRVEVHLEYLFSTFASDTLLSLPPMERILERQRQLEYE